MTNTQYSLYHFKTQKRAMRTIYPHLDYDGSLVIAEADKLERGWQVGETLRATRTTIFPAQCSFNKN